MISPIPAWIALPIIVVVASITLGRWIVFGENVVDRLVNRSLAWAVVGLLLHQRGVAPGVASWLHQLSLGCILFILAGIYGIAALWGGADPDTARLRQRRYDAATAGVFVAVLAAGTPARGRGLLIDQSLGWPSIVFWGFFGVPLAVCAVLILSLSLREFRGDDLRVQERLVYYAIFAAAGGLLIDAVAGPSVAAFHTFTGIPSSDPQMVRKAATFFAATLTAALITAVPLASAVLSRLGWLGDGRDCRRLLPLWRDLTDLLPGVVLYSAAELAQLAPQVRLHRMNVEIRDALLQLRPYMHDLTDTTPFPGDSGRDTGPSAHALRVASAFYAKTTGAQLELTSRQVQIASGAPGGDPDTELRSLLELARDWPAAKARVHQRHTVVSLPDRPNKEQAR
ncbi:hypothetical protein APR12_004707 [Nocardia amikacinitolerans]|uniref:MAB_1171c family putative transporter n=1 Tax=Nocardia amikacinitolerans TaxID=756689 RepID=UPI00082AF048|nr:MAB_1171c family putative transporter [Nocardia amikacinitolerans]MCP2319340.1 hypothetical protein [Nocardia amikacinitolerans]